MSVFYVEIIVLFSSVLVVLYSISQKIGWRERLRNDLICVVRDENHNSVDLKYHC